MVRILGKLRLKSVLYVSRASLPPEDTMLSVEALVGEARRRNQALHITGALIFTGHHFAQLVEGPAEQVDRLMASIMQDSRHRSVRQFDEQPADRRLFPEWSLAYSGPSTYVDRHVRELFAIHHDDLPRAREELIELLTSLSLSPDG